LISYCRHFLLFYVVALHTKEEAIFFEAFPQMGFGKRILLIVSAFLYLTLNHLNNARVPTKSKVANEVFYIS
jgi:hypothetical protein